MFRQQLSRVTARGTAHHISGNTGCIATPRKAFGASAQRLAEVEITIDGMKVMIEQVSLATLFGLLHRLGCMEKSGC